MTKVVGVAEFKANCTRLLREMQQDGEPVTVTNRGRVVAMMVPPPPEKPGIDSLFGALRGTVTFHGDGDDLVRPAWDEPWNAERGVIFDDEEQEREDRERIGLKR